MYSPWDGMEIVQEGDREREVERWREGGRMERGEREREREEGEAMKE